jgi:hypothetical protein
MISLAASGELALSCQRAETCPIGPWAWHERLPRMATRVPFDASTGSAMAMFLTGREPSPPVCGGSFATLSTSTLIDWVAHFQTLEAKVAEARVRSGRGTGFWSD